MHIPFTPSSSKPLISEITGDLFIITCPTSYTHLVCDNTIPRFTIPQGVPGTIKITMTHRCSLHEDRELSLSTGNFFARAGHPWFRPDIISASKTLLTSLVIKPFVSQDHPKFLNASHILNTNWTLSTTAQFIHNHFDWDALIPVNLPKVWSDVVDSISIWHIMLIEWTSSVTFIIIYT